MIAGNDKARDTATADAPADPQKPPPGGPNNTPPKDKPTDEPLDDVAEPVVDPQTDVPTTPAQTEPPTQPPDPTTDPTTDPPPTEPPTDPPPTEPPPVAPHLTGVDSRRSGLPLVGPWKMAVSVAAENSAPATIKVEYRFSGLVLLLGRSGAGWQCDGVISAVNPFDGPMDCTYDYTGGAVPEVVLNVVAVAPDPRSGPSATVRLYVDGKLVDSGSF
jgi:hypothetical protein